MISTDAALVTRTRDGDDEAFRALYERHRPAVEQVCRKWLRDPYLVEDAVQSTFLKAWAALEVFEGGDAVDRWLRRIAKNHCHDVWRGVARANALSRIDDLAVDVADPASLRFPGQSLDRLAVENVLRNLGRRDASLLVQRHIGESSVSTMAAQWGLTRRAMDVALHRARLRARKLAVTEGLRGLLPLGLLRRISAAFQRFGATYGDAGAVLVGVCNIAAAVTMTAPEVPPAYADELAGGVPEQHAVAVQVWSLPVANRALTEGSPIAGGAARVADPKRPTARPADRVAPDTAPALHADRRHHESVVAFDPVELPGSTTVSSKPPPGEPERSIVVRPVDVGVREYDDPSLSDTAKPAFDIGCDAGNATGDQVIACEE